MFGTIFGPSATTFLTPSLSVSANCSEHRSSNNVSAPNITPMKQPSGRRTRKIYRQQKLCYKTISLAAKPSTIAQCDKVIVLFSKTYSLRKQNVLFLRACLFSFRNCFFLEFIDEVVDLPKKKLLFCIVMARIQTYKIWTSKTLRRKYSFSQRAYFLI